MQGERGGADESRDEWLKQSAIKDEILAEWEVFQQRRLEEEQYKEKKNSRRAQRDRVAAMKVHCFKDTSIGRLFLSQKISSRQDAIANRKPDAEGEGAMTAMRADDFMLY